VDGLTWLQFVRLNFAALCTIKLEKYHLKHFLLFFLNIFLLPKSKQINETTPDQTQAMTFSEKGVAIKKVKVVHNNN